MSRSVNFANTLRVGVAALAMLAVTATVAESQEFVGRSRIELQAGLAVPGSSSTTAVGSVVSEANAAGALGAIAFSHWFKERAAVVLSAGVMAVDVESNVSVGNVSSRTAAIVPLFGGVRLYLTEPSSGTNYRPYISLTAGPVIGTESDSRVGNVIVNRSVTRTAFGGRVGAGLDVPFARRWVFGVFGGMCGMTDFSEAIGNEKNYSAPDFGVSIGLLFGGA